MIGFSDVTFVMEHTIILDLIIDRSEELGAQ